MQFIRCNLETCRQAVAENPDAVIVAIDVLRAFTTAAHLVHAGAGEIILVANREDALAWRQKDPACLLLGEYKGIKLPDFDLGNSPSGIELLEIPRGTRVIQMTTCGTRGAVYAADAAAAAGFDAAIFCAALTNAAATARTITKGGWQTVILVETGVFPENSGDEDVACSDYLINLLTPAAQPLDHDILRQRVKTCHSARLFFGTNPDLPMADLDCAIQIDRFDFAMSVQKTADGLILTPERIYGYLKQLQYRSYGSGMPDPYQNL